MNKNTLINGVIVFVAVGCGFALSLKPWEVYREQRISADEAIADMKESEARMIELTKQEARYKTSVGKEELARERGLLPAGEIPAPK